MGACWRRAFEPPQGPKGILGLTLGGEEKEASYPSKGLFQHALQLFIIQAANMRLF